MGCAFGGVVCRGTTWRLVCVANEADARVFDCATGASIRTGSAGERIFRAIAANTAAGHERDYGWRRSSVWARIFSAGREHAGQFAIGGSAAGSCGTGHDDVDASQPDSGAQSQRAMEPGIVVAALRRIRLESVSGCTDLNRRRVPAITYEKSNLTKDELISRQVTRSSRLRSRRLPAAWSRRDRGAGS